MIFYKEIAMSTTTENDEIRIKIIGDHKDCNNPKYFARHGENISLNDLIARMQNQKKYLDKKKYMENVTRDVMLYSELDDVNTNIIKDKKARPIKVFNESIISYEFEGLDFSDSTFHKASISNCVFNECTFHDIVFEYSIIYQCDFTNCTFVRCKFTRTNINATGFSDCCISNCLFNCCDLSDSTFVKIWSNSTVRRDEFEPAFDNSLMSCAFRGCNTYNTVFPPDFKLVSIVIPSSGDNRYEINTCLGSRHQFDNQYWFDGVARNGSKNPNDIQMHEVALEIQAFIERLNNIYKKYQ